jgi:magnesium transporter
MATFSSAEDVATLIRESKDSSVGEVLAKLSPSEVSRAISRLDLDERTRLFELLPPDSASPVVQAMPLALKSEVLRNLRLSTAAAILDRLLSDDQTDLLSSLDEDKASDILALMAPGEAADVNRLSRFASDTAGGLMATEFLVYPANTSVADVVSDLRARAEEYARYSVQYVYVVSEVGQLIGVVRLRDLLFHSDQELLKNLPLGRPITVTVETGLTELRDFFKRHRFFAAPVIDKEDHLIGVVTRADFDEASADQASKAFLRFSGIVFGEEFRSMSLLNRVGGRLAWLVTTLLLSFSAASVVGLFQDTLSEFIALAVFLPVISGMSGNAGNQAIAVSMRELSLGLIRPAEIVWVLTKEASVGVINGLTLGIALTLIALLWKGNPYLGLVVGAAQAVGVLLASCLGGIIPMLLKRLGFDPAVASAPLLTTITDATGFFLTLVLASLWLTA